MNRLPNRADLQWVKSFRRSIAARWDQLDQLIDDELGRPSFQSLTAEAVPLLSACRWIERHGRATLRSHRLRGGSIWQMGQRHRVRRAPLGRVGIIATWNYPVQLLGVQLVQAMAGGNRVVVKPSERTPQTQRLLLEIARRAGADQDRLTWTAATREAGGELLAAGGLDHVVFTGQTDTGRAVASTLAQSLTPSTLELSGSDTALVLADADLDHAARSLAMGLHLNAGRTCMMPRRIICDTRIAEALSERLRRQVQTAVWPRGIAARPEVAQALVLAGDRSAKHPAVVVDPPLDSDLARGEHFGPVLALLPAAGLRAMLDLYERFDQRLATAVFTRDVRAAEGLAPRLRCGTVTINGCILPTAHPGAGLPALGPSGWGVTRGAAGLLAMTRPVYVSRSSRRFQPPVGPPSEAVQQRMARAVRWWYGR